MSRSQLTEEQLKQIKHRKCWIEVSSEIQSIEQRQSEVFIARVFEQGYETEWYLVVRSDMNRAIHAAINNFGFCPGENVTVYEFTEPQRNYCVVVK